MKTQLLATFSAVAFTLATTGTAFAAEINSYDDEIDGITYIADSSVAFPDINDFALPVDCDDEINYLDSSQTIADITSCLPELNAPENVSENECLVTADLPQGRMHLPCVEVILQDSNTQTLEEPIHYAIDMRQRGNSMNWEVDFVQIFTEDEGFDGEPTDEQPTDEQPTDEQPTDEQPTDDELTSEIDSTDTINGNGNNGNGNNGNGNNGNGNNGNGNHGNGNNGRNNR